MFRNMLKKITSIALAFTLIGVGSAIEMKTNSQEAALHTAHAAVTYCPYHACGSYTELRREVDIKKVGTIKFKVYTIYEVRRCNVCGRFLSKTYLEEHWVQQTFQR